ncbi:MAG: 4Fe-4S binding protein [Spirochaetales bacterium]|jgi:Fe-S-cluster-containing hydrogenase component 2|nr:4Fe-4S binding protein [Spirochaetales bacterium]
MIRGIQFTGIASQEELSASPGVPTEERFEKGPVAVIECVQEIPCNPCEHSCSSGAIFVGEPITRLPVLDAAKCIGCGECLASCPGLAIFWVHKNYTDSTSLVEFPYEYLPLPKEGSIVPCGGRDGAFISEGRVVKIKKTRQSDGTTLVRVEVPKDYFMDIRTIVRKGARDV